MEFLDTKWSRSQIPFDSPFRFAPGPYVCLGGFWQAGHLLPGIFFVLSGLGGGVHLRLPQLCLCLCPTQDVLVLVEVLGYQEGR